CARGFINETACRACFRIKKGCLEKNPILNNEKTKMERVGLLFTFDVTIIFDSNYQDVKKTLKKGTNDQMDKEVFMHFLKRRESKLPVFGYMLQDYGRQYLQKNDHTSKLKTLKRDLQFQENID
ncbi:hypothetical protein A3Q56_07367, partial [Intoshia linei]